MVEEEIKVIELTSCKYTYIGIKHEYRQSTHLYRFLPLEHCPFCETDGIYLVKGDEFYCSECELNYKVLFEEKPGWERIKGRRFYL